MGKVFASDEQLLKKVAYAKRMRRLLWKRMVNEREIVRNTQMHWECPKYEYGYE